LSWVFARQVGRGVVLGLDGPGPLDPIDVVCVDGDRHDAASATRREGRLRAAADGYADDLADPRVSLSARYTDVASTAIAAADGPMVLGVPPASGAW
jgi:hypothetical protein